MRKIRKILLISHEMTYTGAPRSLLNIACLLKKAGYEITVWTLQSGKFEREFSASGFNVSIMDTDSMAIVHKIRAYDLAILNTFFCAKLVSVIQPEVRTILYIREGKNIPDLVKNCHLHLEDIEQANEVICISEYAEKFIREQCSPKKLYVVHNFVKDEFDGGVNYPHNHEINYLISGTVEWRKGHDIALEAFLNMPEELRQITKLHIVGRKPEWSKAFWEGLIPNDKRIIDHGEIEDEAERLRLYKKMNVFVIASRDEACSLVALEGAMLGKAVVFSENTGAQYLDVKKRRVYPTEDAGALCRQMCELTSRTRLVLEGAGMRRQYLKTSTEKQYLKQIEKVIQERQI